MCRHCAIPLSNVPPRILVQGAMETRHQFNNSKEMEGFVELNTTGIESTLFPSTHNRSSLRTRYQALQKTYLL